MPRILEFPGGASSKFGFERVKATYTVRELSRQFGVSEHYIRRWTREGLIQTAPGAPSGELRYDFRALRLFRRVRELRGKGLSLKRVEAELRGQLNLFPEPEGQLIRLPVKLTPFEEALLAHERGDRRAADLYSKAIAEDDSVADAYCNLGILEFESGRVAGAFDRFTEALRQDPRHFESHFNLGNLYFEAEDLRLARLHYELAAQIEPNFPHTYFNLGLAHAIGGDLKAAIEALETAREASAEEDRPKIDALLEALKRAASSQGNR